MPPLARVEAAHRKIADCDSRLAKYRAALEAGAEPRVVSGWAKEVEAERRRAAGPRRGRREPAVSEDEVRALVAAVQDGLIGLTRASPGQRTAMSAHMGLRLTYHPDSERPEIESRPDACAQVRVGGGT